MEHHEDLGIYNCKNNNNNKKKISTGEFGHTDLLSVNKSNFGQMPISRENIVFGSDSIKGIPELNFLKFKQMDYPRWLPRVVTKNSINMKMTISQELLIKINPTLFQN